MARAPTRLRRLILTVLRLVAALLLAVFLAELLVRAAGLRPPPRTPVSNQKLILKVSEKKIPGLGHMLRPGARATTVYPGGPSGEDHEVVYEINDLGLREESFRAVKGDGVYRVLMVGDSITYGTGIPLEDTMAHRLRPLLAERFPGVAFEVLNCGVPATNTGQHLALLRSRLAPLQPDLVVLVTTIVDASGYGDFGPRVYERNPASRWIERLGLTSGRFQSDELPPRFQTTMALRNRSALADLLAHQLYRQLTGSMLVGNYRACWEPDAPGFLSVRKSLGAMVRLAGTNDFRMHVAMFPFLAGLDGDYPFAAEVQRLAEACAQLELPFTDLFDALIGRRTIDLQVHAHDRHPNGFANGLAAVALADALAAGIAEDLAAR